ncbi:MAG TPA: UvrD-helicase domain-containing protein, partial [Trueperaceae bacterium]|nr:UvrD-helicase domain-containing protein [Trueperaceae bacterium]
VGGATAFGLAGSVFRLRSLSQTLTFGSTELDVAVGELYEEAYARYLRRLGSLAMAPGEVERTALRLLGSATARDRLARRYPLVLVDEYQDVNPLQGEFFERLATAGVSLEVVGDPKQSIYGFRSADVTVFRRALDAAEASGDMLEPLTASRRHSQAVVGFLNRLTSVMAEAGLGFTAREAPPVTAAGSQADVEGRVDVIVAERQGALADARRVEADLLADRLERAHQGGREYHHMAVVARQHHLLGLVERALAERGIPSLRLKGSGFYRRNEVRDVYHALRVGVDPAGASLTAFLRGPLAGLGLADLAAVSNAAEPLGALAAVRPDVLGVIDDLGRIARLPPIDAVKAVIRTSLAAGKRLVDLVDARGRANVDALLFELAAQTPPDLELLLDRLDELAERAEAADVPEGGEGVRLLTMHGSKGLEYPLVAVFDAGAPQRYRPQPVLVDAGSGSVALHAAGGDGQAQAERSERDRHEAFRLLYVAASRARDHLVVTGSVNRPEPQGWLELLLGPVLEGGAPSGTHVTRTSEAPARRRAPPREAASGVALAASAWIDARFAHHPYEPLSSPSRLVGLLAEAAAGAADAESEATEPLAAGESTLGAEQGWQPSDAVDAGAPGGGGPGTAGELPGRGRVIGTLVHFAISQDWGADDDEPLDSLRAQEVMFPYSAEQQDELLAEVRELLGGYQVMLGAELPALGARASDRAEVPLAVRGGSTVWEGVIDRLYSVDGRWIIDDY